MCLLGGVCLLGDDVCVQHAAVAAVLVLPRVVVLLLQAVNVLACCDVLRPGEGGAAVRQCLITFSLSSINPFCFSSSLSI